MGELRFQKKSDHSNEAPAQDHLQAEANAAGYPEAVRTGKREKPKSYLETGVNCLTSTFISNDKLRNEVNHYACEFAKTATLFAGGRTGIASTFFVYGLAQASPETKWTAQIGDFALGAAKGESIKGLFNVVGAGFKLAPTKGILIGLASRGAEAVFQRDTFTNPNKVIGTLSDELMNKQAWLFDGLIFTVGEGLFKAGNSVTGGAIAESKLASGMFMGGSFGAINGAASEIGRQNATGEKFDFLKVAEKSLLQGGLDAAAAGVGMKGTDLLHQAQVGQVTSRIRTSLNSLHRLAAMERHVESSGPAPPSHAESSDSLVREFVVADGKELLDTFRNNQAESAMLGVRELLGKRYGVDELGPLKKLFVQRLRIGDQTLLPGAQKADLVASCFPENLSGEERAKHVFSAGHGRVWLQTGPGDRLQLTGGWHPVSEWRHEAYNEPYRLDGGNTTVSAIAELLYGDPHNLGSVKTKLAFEQFDRDLSDAKTLGIDSVSTDVWWNLVEPRKGEYNWSYYEKLAEHIRKAGLKWTPILSFHNCGGNIGDTVNVPLPDWIWHDLAARAPGGNVDALKFVSEQGNASPEYLSFWATDLVIDRYAEVMRQFQEHFGTYAPYIAEINISLGPAGELRYPSYNSHDEGTGYPTRGALQCYSELARASFRDYVMRRYHGDIDAVARGWGINGLTKENIGPPDDPSGFFARNDHLNTKYGRDFIDWYNQSLIDHGNKMMTTALQIFASPDAPFAGIDLGAKIPGVHWRVGERQGDKIILGDRLAEVTSGQIRTSRGDWLRDEDGRGYRDLLSMFQHLQPPHPGTGSAVVPSYTALEMPDGQDGPSARSLPHTLSLWVGQEGQRRQLLLRAENALAGNLSNPYDWDNMRSLLDLPGQPGYYHGVTLLRLRDAVNDSVARAKLAEIIHAIRSIPPAGKKAS